jgi:hypothetical protein
MRDNPAVSASIRALDELIGSLPAIGDARRRQLTAFRGEMDRALALDDFAPARRSLQDLLDEKTVRQYIGLAETGRLRCRNVNGRRPPTSEATNQARRDCLDLLRTAAGRPRLQTAVRPWGRQPDTRPGVVLRKALDPGDVRDRA